MKKNRRSIQNIIDPLAHRSNNAFLMLVAKRDITFTRKS